MYQDLFGLTRQPFQNTPDIALFYEGAQRGAILEALIYAIQKGEGVIKVVGEVGSGKTMICRMLAHAMPKSVDTVFLLNPGLSEEEVLDAIAEELGLDFDGTPNRLQKLNRLHRFLLERHADNRKVVVLIEEAQNMPLKALEEVRMLTNLETYTDKLLQMVLFGQPELNTLLACKEIRQLKERIAYNINLEPFGQGEIAAYLEKRLKSCGYRGPRLFDDGAIKQLTRCSQGLARRVNILADKSLLLAFVQKGDRVTAEHVYQAAVDSEYEVSGCAMGGCFQVLFPRGGRARHWVTILGLMLLLFGVGFWAASHGLLERVAMAFNQTASPAVERPTERAAPSAPASSRDAGHSAMEARATSPTGKAGRSAPVSPAASPAPPVVPETALAGETYHPPSIPAPRRRDVTIKRHQNHEVAQAPQVTSQAMPAEATPQVAAPVPADVATNSPAPSAPQQVAIKPSNQSAPAAPQQVTTQPAPRKAAPIPQAGAVAMPPQEGPLPWLSARMAALRQWGVEEPINRYSIQLMTMPSREAKWFDGLLADHPEWRDHIFARHFKPRGKPDYYLIFYGRYGGFSVAKKAIGGLPAGVPNRGAYVRDIRVLVKRWYGRYPLTDAESREAFKRFRYIE